MATVEQRETQPSGLTTLSNTLDLFNDFKDDKDSDEESFHLPMLDCDDDLDANNKENLSNSADKDVHNGETEDEILNKFETTATPDLDPKIEDKLLDEIDELCEKKTDKETVKVSSEQEAASQNLQNNEEDKGVNKAEGELDIENKETNSGEQQNDGCLNLPESENTNTAKKDDQENEDDKQEDTAQDTATDTVCEKISDEKSISEKECIASKQVELDEQVENEKTDEPNITEKNIDNSEILGNNEIAEAETLVETNKNDIDVREENEEVKNNKNTTSNVENEEVRKDTDLPNVEEKPVSFMENNETIEHEDQPVTDNIAGEIPESQTEDKMEVDEFKEISQTETTTDKESTSKITDDFVEAVSTECESDSQNKNNVLEKVTESKCMDIELPECDTKENIVSELDSSNGKASPEKDPKENINDTEMEDSSQHKENDCKLIEKEDKIDLPNEELCEKEEEKEDKSTEFPTLDQSDKPKETVHSNSENEVQEKCENSNDSNKNNDCEEDLLDISIIRDADEDNASAIAENANDNHSSEKSDNDDQDEGSEKAENEESEMDQDESSFANDKDDRMDFEDGNSSNLAYQENMVSDNTSDSEAKDYDTRDSENESNGSVLKEKTNRINGIIDSEKNQTDAITTEIKDADSESVAADDQDSRKENSVKLGGKRLLTDTENHDATNKKIKLADSTAKTEKKKSKKVKTLVSFEKYMQDKKFEKKLTRSDLEQFCLQKICEAIVHKTDVGELHQTIKKQEQIIENLRKDLQQLTKQTRDLDIVNKKLMNELRAQNGIKKPLVPLKITRSVGLQVKLNIGPDNTIRRKTVVTPNSRTPNSSNNSRQKPTVPPNASVVRQIAASPRKTPTATPILSQALQTNRQPTPTTPVVKRPPIRPKPTEPQKPANPGVIDLTDEDDRASKTATGAQMKLTKTNLPLSQTKNMNVIQTKTVPVKTVNTVNQNKTVAIGQVKATTVGSKVTTPTRTVTTLPQGVRLTPTQVKNGSITIPASVVTSSAGTTQLMYVVQPTSSLGPVVTTTAGGTQKAVLLNFQSANGVLRWPVKFGCAVDLSTSFLSNLYKIPGSSYDAPVVHNELKASTLNGSAVSVIPTKTTNTVQLKTVAAPRKHPAPLPLPPPMTVNALLKPLLPKPHLSIRKTDTGIILQWRMPYNLDIYEGIASYQLFAYQETNAAPSTDMWRKVGDVKALALPMACTLTQFADKNKYYFAVRSVDVHKRIGAFSDPEEISL